MVLLSVLDILLVIVGGAGVVYQAVCILISLFTKPIKFPDAPMDKRYAVLISARNEANVIGNLITCIQTQNWSTFGLSPTIAPTIPPKWRAIWAAM